MLHNYFIKHKEDMIIVRQNIKHIVKEKKKSWRGYIHGGWCTEEHDNNIGTRLPQKCLHVN